MKTDCLDYYLPAEMIAQHPVKVRSESRLLVLGRFEGKVVDSRFSQIGKFLQVGDCLVLNDTKVIPARFFGRRESGGALEGLFLGETLPARWEVMLKGAGKVKGGERIWLKDKKQEDFCTARIKEKLGGGRCLLEMESDTEVEIILEGIGFPPLPPYIKRGRDAKQAQEDKLRYQTVYACKAGAVAAPTAGLHFTKQLIKELKNKKVRFAYLTLHVGAGTFKPVRTETIEEHKIHAERFTIEAKNAEIINSTKADGGRIIAVGTTCTRTLEAVAVGSRVKAASGTTELFIKPGYEFGTVDGMVTNFHLPRSTLLALVAAFAGLENILAAYRHAIEKRYRFYSYGDAMLII